MQSSFRLRSNSWIANFSLIKNLLRLCFCNKNLCKERKVGRGETEKQNSASWLRMINKHVKEGQDMGTGSKEVIMWQRMIFLLKMPLGRRKQENMRIPPVYTMTLQNTTGNPVMKSFSLMSPANSISAKSHLPLITHRRLLGLNPLCLFLVQSWS